MKRFIFLMMGVGALSGCVAMDNKVSIADLPAPPTQYVVDKTAPDDYPGYAAAEGNIYSCRYGIHHESAEEFTLPKAQLFGALLARELPWIASRKVVLERFDVYYNHRLKALNAAGTAIGGAIGGYAKDVSLQNKDIFTFDKLLVDTNPGVERHPKENRVGCDKAGEGEYYSSEISGGHDVVVSWFRFTVDDRLYFYRTYYQFQPENKAQVEAGIGEALQMSVQAIAPKIQRSE